MERNGTYSFDTSSIQGLSIRDLGSLLRLLNTQKREQKKYLSQNAHLNLTCNSEYMIEEDIYNATEYKIRRVKFKMRNIIRQKNKLKTKSTISKEF